MRDTSWDAIGVAELVMDKYPAIRWYPEGRFWRLEDHREDTDELIQQRAICVLNEMLDDANRRMAETKTTYDLVAAKARLRFVCRMRNLGAIKAVVKILKATTAV